MSTKLGGSIFWGLCGLLFGVSLNNLYHAARAKRPQAGVQPPAAAAAAEDSALHEPAPEYGRLDIFPVPPGQRALPSDGWALSVWPATRGRDPAAMVDGRVETAWQSDERQRPGMYVIADLGQPARIGCVELANDSTNVDDYPRRVVVAVSPDGALWRDVSAKEFPQERAPQTGDAAIRLVFPPLTTRFLRVSLQADPFAGYRCGGWWWSVGELKLYGPAAPPTRGSS